MRCSHSSRSGRGWWGDLGADKLARLERLTLKSDEFRAKYEAATLAGDPDAESYLNRAENLEKIAGRVAEEAVVAAQGATTILLVGLALFVGLRLVQGFYANMRYEKQYLRWRANPSRTAAGVSWIRAGLGGLLWLAIVPLTLYRFTVGKIDPELEPYVAGVPDRERGPTTRPCPTGWTRASTGCRSRVPASSTVSSPRSARSWAHSKPCWSRRRGRWS